MIQSIYICLFAIQRFALVKCLYLSCILKIGLFAFICLSFKCFCVYLLSINFLSVIWLKYFLMECRLVYILKIFQRARVFIFDKVKLNNLPFMKWAFDVLAKVVFSPSKCCMLWWKISWHDWAGLCSTFCLALMIHMSILLSILRLDYCVILVSLEIQ